MRPSPSDLTHQLKAEAHAFGFQLVGVTKPDPPGHMDVYSRWIVSGRHGEMSYLESSTAMSRRQDPLLILPECKSILVVGINYQPEENPNSQTRNGKVATYALGDDYHMVIEGKLRKLIEAIQSQIEIPISYRIYTDTGPILERELAQRAGLGWIGKNTCLINPKLGSYFLLGEVLLSIQLEPDPPFELDRCGSCSRCIDSCPTSCILPDRTIDSRQCISYLTIEKRGTIPQEYRDAIGDWLFGCDICQAVCPWNHRFSVPTKLMEFQPREFFLGPVLSTTLSLTEETYQTLLHGSPLKRAKLPGLIRNAAIAGGNSEDPNLNPSLARLLLNHSDPIVRSHCAWALAQLNLPENVKILREALSTEEDEATREEITDALDSIENH